MCAQVKQLEYAGHWAAPSAVPVSAFGPIITLELAAQMMGVPESTMRDWARTKPEFPARPVGKHWLISVDALHMWFADLPRFRHHEVLTNNVIEAKPSNRDRRRGRKRNANKLDCRKANTIILEPPPAC
jgi:hypothetical protein